LGTERLKDFAKGWYCLPQSPAQTDSQDYVHHKKHKTVCIPPGFIRSFFHYSSFPGEKGTFLFSPFYSFLSLLA